MSRARQEGDWGTNFSLLHVSRDAGATWRKVSLSNIDIATVAGMGPCTAYVWGRSAVARIDLEP